MHETREGWLQQAAHELAPLFTAADMPLAAYRLGCGFPATGGLSRKHRTVGQCWGIEASAARQACLPRRPRYLRLMDSLPAIGSRWYIQGHHWEAAKHVTRDGEPAVLWRPIGRKSKQTFTWIWRLTARHALPSTL